MVHEGFPLEWIVADSKQLFELIHDQYKPCTFGHNLVDSPKETKRIMFQVILKPGRWDRGF
jgi:hypothetical protein